MVQVPPFFRERFAVLVLASVTAAAAPSVLGVADPADAAKRTPPPPAAPSESRAAVESEYHKVMDADDEAQAEVDKWIRDNQDYAAKGAGLPKTELTRRIRERFEPVRQAYEDFIKRHPAHAAGRVAYASFLGDLGEEESAEEQLDTALTLDRKTRLFTTISPISTATSPREKGLRVL